MKFHTVKIVVPQAKVEDILKEAHDSSTGGHFEINRTLERIRKRYYWVGCKQEVEDLCRTCAACVARKAQQEKEKVGCEFTT